MDQFYHYRHTIFMSKHTIIIGWEAKLATMEEETNQQLERRRRIELELELNRQESMLRQQIVTVEQYEDTMVDVLEQRRARLKDITPKNEAVMQSLQNKSKKIKETEEKMKEVNREIVNQQEELDHVESEIKKCVEYLDRKKKEKIGIWYPECPNPQNPKKTFGMKCRFIEDQHFKNKFIIERSPQSVKIRLFKCLNQSQHALLPSAFAMPSSGSYYFSITLEQATPESQIYLGLSTLKTSQKSVTAILNFRKQRFEVNGRQAGSFTFPIQSTVKMDVIVDVDYKLMVFYVDMLYDGEVSLGEFGPQDSMFFFLALKNTPTKVIFDHKP